MALRPSHWLSILTSVCAPNRASTQPVSRLLAVPLPHTSSEPLNTVLFAASWQLRFRTLGSRKLNVLPEWVVLRETGLGPFQAEVPVPYATCSRESSTVPVVASTVTVRR